MDRALTSHKPEHAVTLVVANGDALPQERLREFLDGLQHRIDHQRVAGGHSLTVVLTGEVDLSRFLSCGLSNFRCERQYVLAGFERASSTSLQSVT